MQEAYGRVFQIVQHHVDKMVQSHAFYAGLAGIIAIPAWIKGEKLSVEHAVMVLILIGVLILDWMTGITLAHKSITEKKTSRKGHYSIVKYVAILSLCALAVGLDFVLKTKSYVFAFITCALIWTNFYSFLGNVAALGWGKWFPLWLFNLIKDEMETKMEKYFSEQNKKG
jgi:phage-related holin